MNEVIPDNKKLREYYLSLGSNIEPHINLPKAFARLKAYGTIERYSSIWKSDPVGSLGPDFLNAVVLFLYPLEPSKLRNQVLRNIETQLKRVRTADKNAPRTIDIDILICDDEEIDASIWDLAHLAAPLAEIYPELLYSPTGKSITEIALRLQEKSNIVRELSARLDIPTTK
ncbi:MAG: 2-amino-4-hydroxy-6-hydroxymethyldihydropteridine diphosphokinase [Chloroflexi bacterium]|nr:2-amino-4-hydroxy-6-hydroxymethyldihydropteridine diphosphokinase [Chloroflexota bacterium]